jgi:xylulokinase
MFLPYLQGERTPNLPDACGVMHGMNMTNTTPAYLARAAMEGVTLGMAYGLRRMETLGLQPSGIRLTGGGSKSAVWRRIAADLFGYPVVTMQSPEGAALGAAIQALAVADPSRTLSQWTESCAAVDESTRTEPDKNSDAKELLERHCALRKTLFGA